MYKIIYGVILCFVVVAGFVSVELSKHFIEPDYTFGSGYFVLNLDVLLFSVVSFVLGVVLPR